MLKELESLVELATTDDVFTRIDAMNRVAWLTRSSDIDGSYQMAMEAQQLSQDQQYKKGIAYSNLTIAYYYTAKLGEFPRTFKLTVDTLQQLEDIQDQEGYGMANIFIGWMYSSIGNFDLSFKHINKGLEIHRHLKKGEGISWGTYMLGNLYMELKDFKNALSNFEIAEEIFFEEKDMQGFCSVCSGIGQIYFVLKDYDSALEYHHNSLKIAEENNLDNNVARALNDIAVVYAAIGITSKAIQNLTKSLSIRERTNNFQGIITTQTELGRILIIEKDYDAALNFLDLAEGHAYSMNAKPKLTRIKQLKAELFKKKGEFERALVAFEDYMTIRAESMGEQNALQLKNMQAMFDIQKAEQQAALEKLKNNELKIAYNKIEKQSEDIFSSIRYAKRIQDAVLSPVNNLKDLFTDAFILLKPRDIVSGDFYWFKQVGNEKIVIAADCTGHGVPGAFMVLLGNTLLNQIIEGDKVTKPSEIIRQLDKRLSASFSKHGQNVINDGMDIAIVAINENENKVTFSGAKNPLIAFKRNGELSLVKGSRFPVGSHQFGEKEFNDEVMALSELRSFYIFSDGYQDQFGSDDNVKFTSKKFRQLLASIHTQPLAEQQTFLERHIDNWKGNVKQTDDVLVVGVRLN